LLEKSKIYMVNEWQNNTFTSSWKLIGYNLHNFSVGSQ